MLVFYLRFCSLAVPHLWRWWWCNDRILDSTQGGRWGVRGAAQDEKYEYIGHEEIIGWAMASVQVQEIIEEYQYSNNLPVSLV